MISTASRDFEPFVLDGLVDRVVVGRGPFFGGGFELLDWASSELESSTICADFFTVFLVFVAGLVGAGSISDSLSFARFKFCLLIGAVELL